MYKKFKQLQRKGARESFMYFRLFEHKETRDRHKDGQIAFGPLSFTYFLLLEHKETRDSHKDGQIAFGPLRFVGIKCVSRKP